MKKKEVISIIIISLVLAAMLFGAIYLANRHRSSYEVRNESDCFCYPDFGNSLFFSEKGKIYEYNTENRQLRILVESEKIESYVNDYYDYSVDQVYKGKLFYHYYSDHATVMNFSYYNLLNGENRLINSIECNLRGKVIIYDGYVYCVYCADNEQGHEVLRISRFNIESGDEEILYESMPKDEYLMTIADGKIITKQNNQNLVSYNIENMKRSLIWSPEKFGYESCFSFSHIGNKLYFLAGTKKYTVKSEPENYWMFDRSRADRYLLCLDLNTGIHEQVLDVPISTYCLTENTIYYSPMAIRSLVVKDQYNASEAEISYTHKTLFSCDLDGQNIREVYTNKDTYYYCHYNNKFKILNGKVYCELGLFNYTNESFDLFDYAEIDLFTREIEIIEIPN